LNGLRKINPNYSYQVDCETLKTIAKCMQAGLRELDLVARFGGDKFAIYLNETVNLQSAYIIINRLRIYAERPTYISETGLIDVGASIGIALSPIDGTNFEELLRVAYQRMQRSKIIN
jgi:diguanylate cyclase (GGDEF)-like protein